jgi:hypothetical protein
MKRFRDTDYFVRENGRVISTKYGKTKELKQFINNDGYYELCLQIDNKPFKFFISRLVAECYLPNPSNLPEVEHIDCNKSNNSVSNLEWVTRKENMNRASKNGLLKKSVETKLKMSISNIGKKSGEKHGMSKLTESDVLWIRNNCIPNDKEFGCKPLSIKFNVTLGLISNIIKRKLWKHI